MALPGGGVRSYPMPMRSTVLSLVLAAAAAVSAGAANVPCSGWTDCSSGAQPEGPSYAERHAQEKRRQSESVAAARADPRFAERLEVLGITVDQFDSRDGASDEDRYEIVTCLDDNDYWDGAPERRRLLQSVMKRRGFTTASYQRSVGAQRDFFNEILRYELEKPDVFAGLYFVASRRGDAEAVERYASYQRGRLKANTFHPNQEIAARSKSQLELLEQLVGAVQKK